MNLLPSGDHLVPRDSSESRAESATEPVRKSESRPSRTRQVLEGAKGGFVATLVMTAYRVPVARSPPPPAVFWSKFVAGGDPSDHEMPAMALHLLYGVTAGALFGLLSPIRNPRDGTSEGEARREGVGLLWGLGYAVALSVFGERVMLERLLGMDLAADERLVFHVGHLVYGLTLGTWLGSRTGDER